MKVRITELRIKAAVKPNGYAEDWFAVGKSDGRFLEISRFDYERLMRKHAGFGDRIYYFLHPIALWLDRKLGTNLANCGGCQKRREWLNSLLRSTHR